MALCLGGENFATQYASYNFLWLNCQLLTKLFGMERFPTRLSLPSYIVENRVLRLKELLRSSFLGVVIRLIIIIFELLGVWLYSSAALLMDAIASSVDVLSSLLMILFIKLAARPPDEDHPFGHGRYEPFVGVQLGVFLAAVGCGMGIYQLTLLPEVSRDSVVIDHLAWLFPCTAVVLLEACYQIVMRTARRQHSPALEADAYHYRIDALTSLFAALALVGGFFLPSWSHIIDHVGAITIAVLMITLGLKAAKHNFHQLVDRIPQQEFFTRVAEAAHLVPGVLGTEKIGIQQYGPDAHVDIDIEVDPKLCVEEAHKISQKVRLEIQKDWPAVRDVIVHIEPYYPNDH